jgi:hypothetical protein
MAAPKVRAFASLTTSPRTVRGRMAGEPVADARIEAHHRMRSAVTFEVPQHRAAQRRGRTLPAALELDQQRYAAGDELEQVAQGRDRFGRAAQRNEGQLGDGARCHRTEVAGQAVKLPVVEHDRAPIGAALHVALDPEARIDRGFKRAGRVLDPARPVQPAMRVSDPAQPLDPRRIGRGGKPAVKA